MTIWSILLVGIGGFFGAMSRFAISQSLNDRFPTGTLTVNLLGAGLLGFITGTTSNEQLLLLAGTGFLGAFTTFSTMKLEADAMPKTTRTLYIAITYVGGIVLAFLGYTLGTT